MAEINQNYLSQFGDNFSSKLAGKRGNVFAHHPTLTQIYFMRVSSASGRSFAQAFETLELSAEECSVCEMSLRPGLRSQGADCYHLRENPWTTLDEALPAMCSPH